MMRFVLMPVLAGALAACDSGVPPPGQEPPRASAPQVAADQIELSPDGIAAGVESFYFAAGRREVEGAIESALGESGAASDCNGGSLATVAYPGGLAAHFEKEFLVGWRLEQADQSPLSQRIGVVGDVQTGDPAAQAREAEGFAAIENADPGEAFALGNRMGGVIEDGRVAAIYAGKQCGNR